jgi:molybdopterin-containing oxidoreductase family iron-sulfur binding subunit
MDESRRSFLKETGLAAVGVSCGFPLLAGACASSSAQEESHSTASTEDQWAMVIDVEKCLAEEVQQACIDACHRAHNVPDIPEPEDEVKWIWSEEYETVFPDQVHARTAPAVKHAPILILCNHCDRPPCVRVCPTQATWKREQDGIVMMDMHRCIGCRYCIAACPYGSRSFNWKDPQEYITKDANGDYFSEYPARTKGVVEKCNFCAERLREGLQPACVEAVQEVEGGEGALVFGNMRDPDSEVSRILNEKHTITRRVGLGTGPNVYYIV